MVYIPIAAKRRRCNKQKHHKPPQAEKDIQTRDHIGTDRGLHRETDTAECKRVSDGIRHLQPSQARKGQFTKPGDDKPRGAQDKTARGLSRREGRWKLIQPDESQSVTGRKCHPLGETQRLTMRNKLYEAKTHTTPDQIILIRKKIDGQWIDPRK